MNAATHTATTTTHAYGATYCTEGENFGEITHIFEVGADWDGYRFHGYCKPSDDEIAAFFA